MRLVAVPGRTVRHWETGRVIDDRGVAYDPLSPIAAHYVEAGDLELAEDLVEPEPTPIEPAPSAAPAAE